LRVTNVIAHEPGIKLLDGLAEASTNGETTYAYRCRPQFLSTLHGLDRASKVPYCYWSGRRTVGDTPWPRRGMSRLNRSATTLAAEATILRRYRGLGR